MTEHALDPEAEVSLETNAPQTAREKAMTYQEDVGVVRACLFPVKVFGVLQDGDAALSRIEKYVEALWHDLHEARLGRMQDDEDELETQRARIRGLEEGESKLVADLVQAGDRIDELAAALEDVADFLEVSSATASRRDEPEMASILSNVSYKTRAALKETP